MRIPRFLKITMKAEMEFLTNRLRLLATFHMVCDFGSDTYFFHTNSSPLQSKDNWPYKVMLYRGWFSVFEGA